MTTCIPRFIELKITNDPIKEGTRVVIRVDTIDLVDEHSPRFSRITFGRGPYAQQALADIPYSVLSKLLIGEGE